MTISSSVTTIGWSAFYGCSGLTSLQFEVGSELTDIQTYAFHGCTGLTGDLTIPSRVTKIGDYAFKGCQLDSVTLSSTAAPSVGTNSFDGTYPIFYPASVTGYKAGNWLSYGSRILPDNITVISTKAIAGVTVPATGAAPDTTVDETAEYTATISWLPVDATFKGETVYTATITITPKAGYTLIGVRENFFKVAGATATNVANSGVVTAVFPETAPAVISIAEITGVTVPATGAVPDTTVDETTEYTAEISWSPADATFKVNTVYTATITITPKTGYTLTGVPANFFTVAGATATNVADSGIVTAVFLETAPITYTVTFNVNGGSTVATISNVTSGSAITVPTAPTKTGCTFAGWYKEPTCTNGWNFASDVVTADITLYAKWIAETGSGITAPDTPTSSSGGNNPPAPVTRIDNGGSTTSANLKQLVSESKTLTVDADKGAKLVFDTEALKGIVNETSRDIKVEMKDVSPAHQENLPGKRVFALTVSSGSTTISNFDGAVTASLPYELKGGGARAGCDCMALRKRRHHDRNPLHLRPCDKACDIYGYAFLPVCGGHCGD